MNPGRLFCTAYGLHVWKGVLRVAGHQWVLVGHKCQFCGVRRA